MRFFRDDGGDVIFVRSNGIPERQRIRSLTITSDFFFVFPFRGGEKCGSREIIFLGIHAAACVFAVNGWVIGRVSSFLINASV